MKASELPESVVLNHLHLVPEYVTAADREYITALQQAAISFVCRYCSIDSEYVDSQDELAIAVLVLVGDMYDNRTRYVDKSNLNQTVETILSLHDHNIIGGDENAAVQ